MDSRWLDHIDAHIAAGQVAAEAESAELLSWLLKLESEQRWCLVLNRDKRLERLSASDYRRLLALMVEHESKALADAPQPPYPCLPDLTLLPAPEPVARLEPSVRRPRPPLLLLAVFVTLAVVFWLGMGGGAGRFANLGDKALVWVESLGEGQDRLADIDDRVNREIRTTERLQRLMTARTALEALERNLTAGGSIATELAVLERVWPIPEQLAPLKDLSAGMNATPETLLASLTRLRDGLDAKGSELLNEARAGRVDANTYYARMGALSSLQSQGESALAAAGKGDWAGARQVLADVEDSDYRAWRQEVESWLRLKALVTELSGQLWAHWLEGLPQEPAAEMR